MNSDQNILYRDECYAIVGACMEVHRTLGCGFLESVYQEVLVLEFQLRGIPFAREQDIEINYKGTLLSKTYKVDFICYDHLIVEIKAVNQLTNDHAAQLLNYLKASQEKVGLLINFGTTSLQHQRYVL